MLPLKRILNLLLNNYLMNNSMKRLLTLIGLYFLLFPLNAQETKDDTIVVGYTSAPPFLIIEDDHVSGINMWLWKEVANEAGLNYEFKQLEFSQMITALEEGTIDVSINPLTITAKRSKNFNFTQPYYAAHATVIVHQPKLFRRTIDFIKNFFSLNFLRGLLILFVIIFLFGFLVWRLEKKRNPEHFRTGINGIWDGLWWSAVTLTTVGYGDKAPKTKSGKVAALALMFIGLLFISGLTASIASSLTVNEITNKTENFEDFKEKEVGTINNTSSQTFLKRNFFKNLNYYSSVNEGLDALNNKSIQAFIYDAPIVKYRIDEGNYKRLKELPLKFDPQFYAFGVKKDNDSLNKLISNQIIEVIERSSWLEVLNEYRLGSF